MGIGDERLVNPGAVSETLRCGICTEVYVDPVFFRHKSCQHVFCRACIEQALQRRLQCPTCRGPVKRKHLQPHQVIRSLLDELLVRCDSGCNWTGRQDALPAHMSECPAKLLEMTRSELANKSQKLVDKSEQLVRLLAKIKEQDRQLLSQRLQIADFRRSVLRKDSQIESLQAEVAHGRRCTESDAAAKLAEMQADVSAKAAEQAQVEAAAASKRAQVARKCSQALRICHMQIFIKTVSGKTVTLDVERRDTVEAVKLKLQSKTKIPLDRFYLTYGCKYLGAGSLPDYNIQKEATLNMSMRLLSATHQIDDEFNDDCINHVMKRRKLSIR